MPLRSRALCEPAIAAIEGGQRLYVALKNGVRIYTRPKGALEREISRSGVRALAFADVLLVVGGGAEIYSPTGRHVLFTFDTTSAVAGDVVNVGGVFRSIVASKRHVRYVTLSNNGSTISASRIFSFNAEKVTLHPVEPRAFLLGRQCIAVLNLLTDELSDLPIPFTPHRWTSPTLFLLSWDAVTLVVIDKVGYTFGQGGRILSWSSSPLDMVRFGKFALAIVSGNLEVWSLDTGKCFWRETTDATRLGESDQDNTALLLRPSSTSEIAIELSTADIQNILKKDADTAVSILKGQSFLRTDAPLQDLQFDLACQLFENNRYQEAFTLWSDCNPMNVIERIQPVVTIYEPTFIDTQSKSSKVSQRRQTDPLLDPLVHYLVHQRRRIKMERSPTNVAEAVDTLLFISYAKLQSPLLAPLLRVQNSCNPKIVESYLRLSEQQYLFAEFLNNNGRQKDALAMLAENHENDSVLLSYLESVEEFSTFEKYAIGPLARNPGAVESFYDSPFETAKLASFFGKVGADARALLEYRILQGDTNPETHEIYASYLDSDSLNAFLKKSSSYRPNILLERLENLSPISKALLLGRLGNHSDAIDELLSAKDYDACRQYVDETKSAAALSHFIRNLPDEELVRTINHLNPFAANAIRIMLESLPDGLPANSVKRGLVVQASSLFTGESNAGLREGLEKIHLTGISHKLATMRQQYSVIDELTVCSKCKRRLGKAVLAIQNQSTVHYGCLDSKR